MKNTLKTLLFAVLIALMPATALAQTATTRTYLASALGAGTSANIMTIGSATGWTASTSSQQSWALIDKELVQVMAINGTSITVRRAQSGGAVAHEANALVWFGGNATFNPQTGNIGGGPGNPSVGAAAALPAVFLSNTPSGNCVRASNRYLPAVNPTTGEAWDCLPNTTGTGHIWVSYNLYPRGQSAPHKKLAVTQDTYTTTAVNMIIGVNTTAATTITLMPCTGCEGAWYRIGHETSSSSAITIAGSAGQLVNGGASAAAVQTNANGFQGAYVYNDGTNWIVVRH